MIEWKEERVSSVELAGKDSHSSGCEKGFSHQPLLVHPIPNNEQRITYSEATTRSVISRVWSISDSAWA